MFTIGTSDNNLVLTIAGDSRFYVRPKSRKKKLLANGPEEQRHISFFFSRSKNYLMVPSSHKSLSKAEIMSEDLHAMERPTWAIYLPHETSLDILII